MYATTFATIADADAAIRAHEEAKAVAERSLARCRRLDSIAERLETVRHHVEWLTFISAERFHLAFAA
jgi:hypothetical protein